jgi:hypothetical protein
MTAIAKHTSFRALVASAIIALSLASFGNSAAAATAEERAACTPDVFRLCASEIPNVTNIVSCMKRQRSKLSPACAAVFRPKAETAATRSLNATNAN